MKSLKDYSLNLPEQAYHDLPIWSYSTISKYAKEGFSAISTLHDPIKPTPSMEFGSLFDSILTRGKDTLNYYTVSDTCPPPGEKGVLDYLLTITDAPFYDVTSMDIQQAVQSCNYQPRWSYESQYKHLEAYKDYYEARRGNKKVVSTKDWEDAMEMARVFRSNPYLSQLFGTKSNKDIEYIYQSQFTAHMDIDEFRNVEVKIMPDLVVVNHVDKTIQPVDLKTSSVPAYDFAENFIKYRYDIQASLYTDVLEKVVSGDTVLSEYKILPYLFTDISRTDKQPVTYEYDPRSESQINGLSFGNYNYKNWKTLLGEIIDYEETNAVVPSYIKTEEPNDLLSILNKK